MLVIRSVAELRTALAGRPNVVVPTMGNLHDGHLSLLRMARTKGEFVVATIFVNRLQFAPHEDFDKYPRSFTHDCELLREAGCDLVFAPSEIDLYPAPQTCKVTPAATLADILEGQSRPGFFTGVATVVMKLFNLIQPAAAVFGKKDYQQLLVIRHMVEQLALPIEIVAAETVREADGLARSSRNAYLSPTDRAHAGELHAALEIIAGAVRAGNTSFDTLENEAAASLAKRGWRPDYVRVRNRADLTAPTRGQPLIVVAAAVLGSTRLIDNREI